MISYRLIWFPACCIAREATHRPNRLQARSVLGGKVRAPAIWSRATAREQRKSWGRSTKIRRQQSGERERSAGGITTRPSLRKSRALDVHAVPTQSGEPQKWSRATRSRELGAQIDADETALETSGGNVCRLHRRSGNQPAGRLLMRFETRPTRMPDPAALNMVERCVSTFQ